MGTWGGTIEILRALEKIQDELLEYEIHLTFVTKDVSRAANPRKHSSKLSLVAHPKFMLTAPEIKDLLTQSKNHVALSLFDGFPARLVRSPDVRGYSGTV